MLTPIRAAVGFSFMGYPCIAWRGPAFACEEAASGAQEVSYPDNEQAALLAACPLSCGLCEDPNAGPNECLDVSGYTDAGGYSCSDWQPDNSVCTESGYPEADQQQLLDSCPCSCGACLPASQTEDLCTDDSIFRDEYGFPCTDWAPTSFMCEDAAASYDYSEEGQAAILAVSPVLFCVCVLPSQHARALPDSRQLCCLRPLVRHARCRAGTVRETAVSTTMTLRTCTGEPVRCGRRTATSASTTAFSLLTMMTCLSSARWHALSARVQHRHLCRVAMTASSLTSSEIHAAHGQG